MLMFRAAMLNCIGNFPTRDQPRTIGAIGRNNITSVPAGCPIVGNRGEENSFREISSPRAKPERRCL